MQLDKDKIQTNFPYLSIIENDLFEYMGIILSHNKNTVSFINVGLIKDKVVFDKLVEICTEWWWYSNRQIPINLYYYEEMLPFMRYVTVIASRNTKISGDYYASLETLVETNKNKRFRKVLKIIK